MNRRIDEHKRPENHKKILETHGQESQIIQTIQELSELIKELTLWQLTKPDHIADMKQHIVLEIADVENMLEQMKLIFGDTEGAREMKMRRTLSRMK
jgi:uncharacterized protein with von Willebrand factor type A (vWA) domain